MVTLNILKTIMTYDPYTGYFHYVKGNKRRCAGDRVGTLRSDGYWEVTIQYARYRLHRLAWLWMYGEMPSTHIDHINGDRADNRISNLRKATHSENQQNLKQATSANKCGLLGVYYHKGKYVAQIKLNGRNKYIGRFDTAEAAHNAYIAEKLRVHVFYPSN